MIKDGIALIGSAVIKGDTEQVWMVGKLRRQVKAELSTEEQLIVVNREWIAGWQTRNGLIEAIRWHSNSSYSRQNSSKFAGLGNRIRAIEIQAGCMLSIGINSRSLHINRRIVPIHGHR